MLLLDDVMLLVLRLVDECFVWRVLRCIPSRRAEMLCNVVLLGSSLNMEWQVNCAKMIAQSARLRLEIKFSRKVAVSLSSS